MTTQHLVQIEKTCNGSILGRAASPLAAVARRGLHALPKTARRGLHALPKTARRGLHALPGCIAVLGLFAGVLTASAATNGIALVGDQATVGRLSFQIGSNALPAQIGIEAVSEEISLEARKPDAAKLSAQDLQAIGRGQQLKAPMRLEVMSAGKAIPLAPVGYTAPVLNNGAITSKAKLSGGGVNASVESVLGPDGALTVKVTYGGAKVESLAIAMELNGVVDTAVSGGAPLKTNSVSLADDEGLLWGNAAPVAGAALTAANRGAPGVLSHMFWGSGDRGWTWLTDGESGWTVVPAAPTMTLTRDKSGTVIWRALLVNQPTDLKGEKTVSFTLLTHPAAVRSANFRKAMWLDWPFAGKSAQVLTLNAKGRAGVSGLVRADAGSMAESLAGAVLLEGPAGGDAATAVKTLADTYSLPMFRYLAGTHLGVGGRLLGNSPKLIQPGQNPGCDRMVLGRALLHDLGVDAAGVSHLAMAARLIGALNDFGYFAADGQTEFIPYWRSQELVRYGEVHTGKDAFEEFTGDPMGRVKVSIWRRPAAEGTGAKALIMIINEGDAPVREQLYITQPSKLFGGPNGLTYRDSAKRWDISAIPTNSDWAGIKNDGLNKADKSDERKRSGKFLQDIEDQGGLVELEDKGTMQVYGRTYIPARSFRVFLGSFVTAKPVVKK